MVFFFRTQNKGKNDVSAYKAMVDLGIYLAGLGLGLEETLVSLDQLGYLSHMEESEMLILCYPAAVDFAMNARSG